MPEVKQEWFNRKKTDYETPEYIFAPLRDEFGISLDVCASSDNTKCRHYFSEDDNALVQTWTGACWMNPSFGRELKKWVKKAYESSLGGATVVCLLPARTNTQWFHDYCLNGEVRFIKGEVKFVGYERGLWMPFMVVIFRPPP